MHSYTTVHYVLYCVCMLQPSLVEPIGELLVEENAPARLLVTVNASDPDAGPNGRVSISLHSEPDHSGLFRLSSSSTSLVASSYKEPNPLVVVMAATAGGPRRPHAQPQTQTQVHLWTTRALDREAAPAHVLTLRLTDHGTPARTTDVSFVVR